MTAVVNQLRVDDVHVRPRTNFFMGLALAMLTAVIAAFARTFYLRPVFGAVDGPTGSTDLPWHLLVHGLVMTAWFVFVVAQTLLVAKRNVALHRRLGIGGAALAVAIIVVNMFVVAEYIGRRDAAGMPIQRGVVVGDTLLLLLYFPLAVGAALYFRRNAEAHKRLMLLSGLALYGPVVARYATLADLGVMPRGWLSLVSPFAFLLVLLGYDIAARKRPHWVTVYGIAWAVANASIEIWILRTAAADAYVEWLRHFRLPV